MMSAGLQPGRLSLNTGTLGANVPGAGQGWDPFRIIDACAARGIAGVTFWQREVASNAAAIGMRLRANEMVAWGMCRTPYLFLEDGAPNPDLVVAFGRSLEVAVALGARSITCVVGGMPRGARSTEEILSALAGQIERMLPLAQGAGVGIALEPLHPVYAGDRSCLVSVRDALQLCKLLSSPVLSVALDVYHVWWDSSVSATIRERGDTEIGSAHLCDWLRATSDVLLDRGMIGDGVADLRGFCAMVENAGYAGLYEVEVFSAANWWQKDPAEVLDTVVERAKRFC